MNNKKSILLGCVSLLLCGALYWFLNSTANIGNNDAKNLGGADQFIGKVDVPRSPYFTQLAFYDMQSNDHLTLLPHFKTRQQTTYYTCGPAAAEMVVEHFLGKTVHDEMTVAKMMGTNKQNGTDCKGMVSYFKQLGWETHSSVDDPTPDNYADFLKFVKKNLDNNTPIIVENIDWGGHWRIIIGYDTMGTETTKDDVLIMADSFDTSDHLQDGYNVNSAERFFYMWFDAHLYPKNQQTKLWLTARPKSV